MFSPRQLFSKYSKPITFFKRTEANADIIDLPTPPDSPLYSQIPHPWLSAQRGLEGSLQQSLPSRSAHSLPFPAMRRGDRKNDMTTARPTSSSGSPFRSVSQMKEPFNLILPNSPNLNQPGSRTSKATQYSNHSDPFIQCGLGLQHQSIVKPPATLLPSPTITEMRGCSDEQDDNLGVFEDTLTLCASEEACQSTPTLKYQIPSVPSAIASKDSEIYELGSSSPRLDPQQFGGSQSTFVNDASSSQSNSPNKGSTRQSSSRAVSILSSEGDWLAGTLIYPESPSLDGTDCPTPPSSQWTAASKGRQRRCQIVGHSPKSRADGDTRKRRRENASQQGYATVVSTTDLRLVTIRRTPSKTQAKVAPDLHMKLDSSRRPLTPDRILEISSFSPETPEPVDDSRYSSRHIARESTGSPPEHRLKFRMCSLASTAKSSVHSLKDLDDQISPGKVIASYFLPATDSHSHDRRHRSTTSLSQSPKLHHPPPVEMQKRNGSIALRCDEYAWILDQLTPWIENFPSLTLQLDTPVISHIRHQLFHHARKMRAHNAGSCHDAASCMSSLSESDSTIDTFRRIFPYTSDSIVSALSATLMAQRYLSIFTETSPSPEFSALETIPAKARSTLGIQCSLVTANQRREKLLKRIMPKKVDVLSDIVDRLLTIICGRADDFMKRMLESIVELMVAR